MSYLPARKNLYKSTRFLLYGAIAAASMNNSSALASGFAAPNSSDISALFDADYFYAEGGGFGLVSGGIHLRNTLGTNQAGQPADGLERADFLDRRILAYGVIKAHLFNHADCLIEDRPGIFAEASPGLEWRGRYQIEYLRATSRQYGLTCSYTVKAGLGNLRLIGGYVRSEADVVKQQAVSVPGLFPQGTQGSVDLSGASHGARWGIAYEIPKYSFRASFLYQTEQPFRLTGPEKLTLPPNNTVIDAPANLTNAVPKLYQLQIQSGIAPGWLAFSTVSWQGWSRWQTLDIKGPLPNGFSAYFRNAWDASLGVAHRFNSRFLIAANLDWTQGVSDASRSPIDQRSFPLTDSWTFGIGGRLALTENLDVKLGASVTSLQGGKFVAIDQQDGGTGGGKFNRSWLIGTQASLVLHF